MGADGRTSMLATLLEAGHDAPLSKQDARSVSLRNIHSNYGSKHSELSNRLATHTA